MFLTHLMGCINHFDTALKNEKSGSMPDFSFNTYFSNNLVILLLI